MRTTLALASVEYAEEYFGFLTGTRVDRLGSAFLITVDREGDIYGNKFSGSG